MKIVVIGGTGGLIGSKAVAILRQGGHEVVAASPQNGINTITGEGLKEAMAGAQVVVRTTKILSWPPRSHGRIRTTPDHLSRRTDLASKPMAGSRGLPRAGGSGL